LKDRAMFDPEDDESEYVSPEELTEIMADLKEAGFLKEDGTIDQEAIDNAPHIPFTEYYEWLDKKYGAEEAQEEEDA
jgi:hypothetical protein